MIKEKYSEVLQMKIQHDTVTGEVFTEDGNVYTKKELDLIKGDPLTLHRIKIYLKGL